MILYDGGEVYIWHGRSLSLPGLHGVGLSICFDQEQSIGTIWTIGVCVGSW